MSLARAIFVFALFTPVLGATGSKFMVGALLGQSPQTVVAPSAPQLASQSTPAMVLVATPPPATSVPSPTPTSPTSRIPTVTATAAVSSTTTSVTLTKYWLGKTEARSGDTIPIKYAIENGTGELMYVGLRVSMKLSTAPGWGAALSDPAHDVTAAVAAGSSIHTRYFTLPTGLAPGLYDVAWGLKGPGGQQTDVASSSAALRIVK